MPSSPTCPDAHLGRADDLMLLLARVPDPRDPRGVRYGLAGMLAVAVCAVLTGARSFAAIGEWASELTSEALDGLGLEDRSTVRTGRAPHVMASLRNTAITLLRLTGQTNIAAGLRHHSRHHQ